MSIEQLQADYASNSEAIRKLDALTSVGDLVNLLKFTIWPFQENVVNLLSEQDAAIQDLVDGLDDVLTQESAGVIAAPIVAARAIIAKYKASLGSRLATPEARAEIEAILQFERMAAEAEELIQEIVVLEPDDQEDDEDEDEDEDDEEADNDNAEVK